MLPGSAVSGDSSAHLMLSSMAGNSAATFALGSISVSLVCCCFCTISQGHKDTVWCRLSRVWSPTTHGTDPMAEETFLVQAGGSDYLRVNRPRLVISAFLSRCIY